jgi:hypothetical protein
VHATLFAQLDANKDGVVKDEGIRWISPIRIATAW